MLPRSALSFYRGTLNTKVVAYNLLLHRYRPVIRVIFYWALPQSFGKVVSYLFAGGARSSHTERHRSESGILYMVQVQ